MTCDDVRERLLTEATSRFGLLATHLQNCPSCARLERRIRFTEEALASSRDPEIPMASASFESAWAHARTYAPPRAKRRGWSVHGALVALAAAAVVVVTLWGNPIAPPPAGPDDAESAGAAPAALQEGLDLQRAFNEIEAPTSLAELSRKEQDAALLDWITRKKQSLVACEEALTMAAQSGDALNRAHALATMAEVHAQMARDITDSPAPTYLDSEQREFYRLSLADQSQTHWAKAEDGLASALDAAVAGGDQDLQRRLGTLHVAVRHERTKLERQKAEDLARRVADGEQVAERMERVVHDLAKVADRCALDDVHEAERLGFMVERLQIMVTSENYADYSASLQWAQPVLDHYRSVCP